MLCALHHVISNNNIAQLHGSLWRAETSRCAVSHITLFITLTPTGLLTPWKKEKGKSSDATQIGSNNIILLLPPTYYTTTYNDLVYIFLLSLLSSSTQQHRHHHIISKKKIQIIHYSRRMDGQSTRT